MFYRILADATMIVHFMFLAYVVAGGFIAWRWPRTWFAHAAVAVYGTFNGIIQFVCPLTPLEHHWRLKAGQAGLEPAGFVETYLIGVVYPAEHWPTVQLTAAAVVLASWIGLAIRLRRKRLVNADTAP
ncbi:DUF2784 domain-containing protein [Glycomyces terrestris]|uniref:DUF2784 domain-containing protein n=1 Tax=Glycomyces terrestris TaxID=2493553 RepID=A0A426V1H2_9ACTN|nr:DUF2784 domain-containing protein [Glycomyces terrestris]RRS00728.1 DUF2784 domain-containing protein [Glycomyces terrestris]